MLRSRVGGKKSLKNDLNAHFRHIQRHGYNFSGGILCSCGWKSTEKPPKHESGAFYETIYFGP